MMVVAVVGGGVRGGNGDNSDYSLSLIGATTLISVIFTGMSECLERHAPPFLS